MLKLFIAKIITEAGMICDCCVKVTHTEADVYARNVLHAEELIRDRDPHGRYKIESLEDMGFASGVRSPGIIIAESGVLYQGPYQQSPFRRE